jgi:hypothetical protein
MQVPLPEHLKHLPYDELQFTLVDCPGHASLIRTIIGGAQIIDLMVLVVDITKGRGGGPKEGHGRPSARASPYSLVHCHCPVANSRAPNTDGRVSCGGRGNNWQHGGRAEQV